MEETMMTMFIVNIFMMLVLVVWPTALAATSKKSEGPEKLVWILASLFLSWIGYFLVSTLVVDHRRSKEGENEQQKTPPE